MDFTNMLLSTNIGFPTAGKGFSHEQGFLGEGQGPEFGNLLDLVEGLEVGELSEATQSPDLLDRMMKQIAVEGEAGFAQQQNNAKVLLDQREMLTTQASVGREVPPMGELRETLDLSQILPSGKEVLVDELTPQSKRAELDPAALLQRNARLPDLSRFGSAESKLSLEQVAAWSQALSSGDIKSVETSSVQDPLMAAKNEAQNQPKAQLSKVNHAAQDMPAQHVSVAQSQSPASKGDSVEGFEAFKAEATDSVSQKEAQPKQDGPVLARDFLLNNQSTLQKSVRSSGAPALSPEVARDVADFVSDKVNQMKQSGSGSLKVKMDTVGLGELEIRVSERRGLVDVQIRSADGNSLAMLRSAQADLTSRLENVVDLGNLDMQATNLDGFTQKLQAQQARSNASLDMAGLMSRATESFEGAESGMSEQGQKQNDFSQNRGGDHFEQAEAAQGRASQDFLSQDKREQAMDQWRQFLDLKQSA